MKASNSTRQNLMFAVAIVGAAFAGGCAGNAAIPAGKITAVERAISDAKASTATVDAPAELKAAEDELTSAKAAMADKKYEEASRFADKASADADYARTRAITAKSRKMADEVRESVKGLRQEIERMPAK